MDHNEYIDQTIEQLKSQIKTLHKDIMSYKPPLINPETGTAYVSEVTALKNSLWESERENAILRLKLVSATNELEVYEDANEDLREEVDQLKAENERLTMLASRLLKEG